MTQHLDSIMKSELERKRDNEGKKICKVTAQD